MTYELFKNEVGGGVAQGDPARLALKAEYATRKAMGAMPVNEISRSGNEVPLYIKTAYRIDDGDDYYELRVELITGRNWTSKFNEKFVLDAVFEKLVRKYDLEEDVSEEDITNFFTEKAKEITDEEDSEASSKSESDESNLLF